MIDAVNERQDIMDINDIRQYVLGVIVEITRRDTVDSLFRWIDRIDYAENRFDIDSIAQRLSEHMSLNDISDVSDVDSDTFYRILIGGMR